MPQTQFQQPKCKPRRMRCQGGFSLNEALISLTVLTSGLLTLAQFQGDLHENRRQTRAQTTAINLALAKIEELRHLAAAGVPLQDGQDVPAEQPGDSTRFARSWTIQPGLPPGIDEVQVVARWEGVSGEMQTTGLRTFITP
jgi:type II secretory pathway pseudopilin PulG